MKVEVLLSTSTALPIDSEEFSLRVKLMNRGKSVPNVEVVLKVDGEVVEEKVPSEIRGNGELTPSHVLKLREGLHGVEVVVLSKGKVLTSYKDEVLVARKDVLQRRVEDLVLDVGSFRIRVAKGNLGYTTMLIYSKSDKLLGVVHPLPKVTYFVNL